jgi:hypothetical protein
LGGHEEEGASRKGAKEEKKSFTQRRKERKERKEEKQERLKEEKAFRKMPFFFAVRSVFAIRMGASGRSIANESQLFLLDAPDAAPK